MGSYQQHQIQMTVEEWMHYVDRVEKRIAESDLELVTIETNHKFADGVYIREVYIPPGRMIISNIHNTEHPFFITEGSVTVRTHKGIQKLQAPHSGITLPMTRRILHTETGVRWATVHRMERPDETVDEIMDRILLPRKNPLLSVTEHARIKQVASITNLLQP